jgi:hypothetical protein
MPASMAPGRRMSRSSASAGPSSRRCFPAPASPGVSTADDVQRFFAELLQGRLLGPQALREMLTLLPAGRIRYGLGILAAPTSCGPAWGHSGNAQGTITVAWNTEDASRQLVLVVNTYPLSGELEAAVRELQLAAFCP